MPVDPQIQTMLDFIASAGLPPIEQGTPQQARDGMRALMVGMVKPEDVILVGSVEELSIPGAEGELAARLYRPEGKGPWPTVLYYHGGGFMIGDLDTHDQSCRRLCRDVGAAVLSVAYRLAPEHPFPAAPRDALAATEWAANHLADLGGNDVLAVAGDSAGGTLSAVVAQRLSAHIAAQLLIYPATDAQGDYPSRTENAEGLFLTAAMMDWFSSNYVPEDADLSDMALAAPMHGDVSQVPPAVVVTAEFDPLRDDGEAYAAKLRDAGRQVDLVRYDGLVHGFQEMVGVSAAADAAVSDMHARFRRLLG